MESYLSKHEEAIITNRSKFIKVDKSIRDLTAQCSNLSKSLSKTVDSSTYLSDQIEHSKKLSN
jgi:septal ring factor EnvC (AmiA/AmiB activator)